MQRKQSMVRTASMLAFLVAGLAVTPLVFERIEHLTSGAGTMNILEQHLGSPASSSANRAFPWLSREAAGR